MNIERELHKIWVKSDTEEQQNRMIRELIMNILGEVTKLPSNELEVALRDGSLGELVNEVKLGL